MSNAALCHLAWVLQQFDQLLWKNICTSSNTWITWLFACSLLCMHGSLRFLNARTVVFCRMHGWLFSVARMDGCFLLHAWMVVFCCMHGWLFSVACMDGCFLLHAWMVVFCCMHGWLFSVACLSCIACMCSGLTLNGNFALEVHGARTSWQILRAQPLKPCDLWF